MMAAVFVIQPAGALLEQAGDDHRLVLTGELSQGIRAGAGMVSASLKNG